MNRYVPPKKKKRARGPVVFLDRSKKAAMIEAILSDFLGREIVQLKLLDIGCGNGGISQYFSAHNNQFGIDIKDARWNDNKGFDFRLVFSESLPFDDSFFDVVISNHVIEHVTDHNRHLSEIFRVLKPGGITYMATPNKSSPIMEGHIGNTMVLRYRGMRRLFESAGFLVNEYSVHLLKNPDQFFVETRSARFLPYMILKKLRPLFPSHIFVLQKPTQLSPT